MTAAIERWLLQEGRRSADAGTMLEGLATRLVELGLPLARIGIHLRALHPQVAGLRVLWTPDRPIEETLYGHETAISDAFARSPLAACYNTAHTIRRRLDGPEAAFDYPILHELKAEGLTDYVVTPMQFGQGETHAISWAARVPGGFREQDLETIQELMPALTATVEVLHQRRTMSTLLHTYLGREAGRRVLTGSIRRGEATTLAAALWYCDLRGFTALSDRIERDQVVELLDDYFGCMAAPVEAMGGEILKFVGDAMLAIFPMRDDLDRDRACRDALTAAERALDDLEELNRQRQHARKPDLKVGLGLHAGAVMYGNIGAPTRLDFTVIGPAVNLVTRIESLCPQLDRTLLTSGPFASPCGSRLKSLGHHLLKGIEVPQEIFGLP
ncbi:MAG TPA: adenylate/guanylate cyclase domain-containing protein [Hypericibacter adhaerens]|jgi:adenylate cyclase|uniref:Adenylate cyclase n=1 Tax=Hypericibacter adhaerens TaxID=2602016 RepID=A0A5J6N6R6_9PROT|nr:adenylate/guanylate cyclase domain-containing protein [Hypericibacter adhaerens]QEX25284.1 adenylate cyclase [Hypericibacter adhaerens]HWA43453.1 adenylate/guanylate cyclase domain-containing protein [Hypericibacter adhaerens]